MKLTLTDDGKWRNEHAAFGTGEPLFAVFVQENRSLFDKSRRRFSVVVDGLNDRNYRAELTLKSFDEREQAQEFAAKLAALLNEQEDNQLD